MESIYLHYFPLVYRYIKWRIQHEEDAKDLAQDTFVRLLSYEKMLRPTTVKSFVYTIASNLVKDYLRHRMHKQEYTSYIYDTLPRTVDVESGLLARDLLQQEKSFMKLLPAQRRKIYYLSRFEEQSAEDISKVLQLSKRTVENHLFIGRKEIRTYMRQCI